MSLDANTLLKLNQTLGTGLSVRNLHTQKVHLYVDSFDEGIGETHLEDRNSLIRSYLDILSTNDENDVHVHTNDDDKNVFRHKIIVSCRANYLPNENAADEWFKPRSGVLQGKWR